MGYSIFEKTMADMKWTEIDEAARNKAIVLFPIGVIEEHGPHLSLGTDIYLAYDFCLQLQEKLVERNQNTLIAPPFYWGRNVTTGAFPGSFTVRKETMIHMLYDIMLCLHRWGFTHVFCVNIHEDIHHLEAILEAIQNIRGDVGLNVRYVTNDQEAKRLGICKTEECILMMSPEFSDDTFSMNQEPVKLDIHAGAVETAWLHIKYPDLADVKLAKGLPDASLTYDDLKQWVSGGETTRKLIPGGYAGNPAGYEREINNLIADDFLASFGAECILNSLS